ncbi:MAG: MFS transporter [Promicromonosporaceae bacterium]|nr:MFS transporter [Promicromonosporaceae bacterium]
MTNPPPLASSRDGGGHGPATARADRPRRPIERDPATGRIPTVPPNMTHRQKLVALSGIMMGTFVAMLAATIVSSSMPRIVADLGGTQAEFTWVITATLLAQTISTPLWGKFADLFNRKALVMAALAITVLSAAAAGFSQNASQLIAFRAGQGLGAGGLMALGTVLMADVVSPRERGRYMGYLGAFMAVSQIGGPLVGGIITDSALGWRWNFFIAAPFAILAAIVLSRTLRVPRRERRVVKIDYWGALLISVGVGLLLLWITFAGHQFAWVSWPSGAMLIGSLAALGGAWAVERVVTEPIIPPYLFQNRTFVLAVIASIAVGVALFGTAVFVSQFLQIARLKTPTQSGLLTIPQVIGTVFAGNVFGRLITKTGRYKWVMILGGASLTGALLGMATITERTPLALMGVYLFLMGLSIGALMQNLVLAVQNTVSIHEMGAGTSTVAFFRTLGGTIGVSALGAVLAGQVSSGIGRGLADLGLPAHYALTEAGGVPSAAEMAHFTEPVREVIQHAYASGVSRIFLLAVPIAVIALVATCLIKEIPLGKMSGLQERDEGAVRMVAAQPASARPTTTGATAAQSTSVRAATVQADTVRPTTGTFEIVPDTTTPHPHVGARAIAEEVTEGGKKLVIIARFVPEIEAICKLLEQKQIQYSCVKGGVKDRDDQVARFQNDPEVQVFVGQIATAGLGITLTAASTMVFYSLDYSMSNFEQARARIHRVGQQQRCTYVYLTAKGTVDEKVLRALRDKADLARTLVDDYRKGGNPYGT